MTLDGLSSRVLRGLRRYPVAAVGGLFIASAAWALRSPVGDWETSFVEHLNGLGPAPRAIWWPVMQIGSLGGALLIAAALWVIGRRRVGLDYIAAATAAWMLAWTAKQLIGRPRPERQISDLLLWDGPVGGLGFPSGHTAVAFAGATVLSVRLGRLGAAIAFILAAMVGMLRVYVGAHYPFDIVGGALIGITAGLGIEAAPRLLDPARYGERG